MKKLFFLCCLSIVLSSCSSRFWSVYTGSVVGGVLGTVVGDKVGGHLGADVGSLVGSAAGAAVGDAIYTSKEKENNAHLRDEYIIYEVESEPVYVPEASIQRIRFVDANRNRCIEAGETCHLIFNVVNHSNSPIRNITPSVRTDAGRRISLSKIKPITLMPNQTISFDVLVEAHQKLKADEVHFEITLLSRHNETIDYRDFSILCAR